MDSVFWAANATPTQRQCSRLAAALGVERRNLASILAGVQRNLHRLRSLTLADLQRLALDPSDAERVFYLVQWEGLQAHLERYGTLPEENLGPLLETLNPIFERHFARNVRLNETLLALYRTQLSSRTQDPCLNLTPLTPPPPTRRFLRWLRV